MKIKVSIVASLALVGMLQAQEVLETIEINSEVEQKRTLGQFKDIVEKTEVISKKQMEREQAVTLIEAIEKSPGVSVTTNCSMCGIKRVMLNGMKGEHSTVLSDGVPFNSTVSSYYGMDALGVSDVESIEIARGSGAALTAPEAIGGTINIISKKASKNGVEFDFAVGEQGYQLGSIVGEGLSDDKKTGIVVSATYSNYDQYDYDNNGVNEAPKLENQSVSIRLTHELTDQDELDFKVRHSDSYVYGGPMTSETNVIASFGASGTANPSFVDGDVRKQYNGDPMGTMESITTTRQEATARWTHTGNSATIQSTLAYADARQESMYEGLDYDNIDKTYFADIKVMQLLGESHILTYGADFKREDMKAESSAFTNWGIEKDDFLYNSYALYVQDSWMMSDKAELKVALRGAKITTDFTGQRAKGNEIDETLLLPRVHFRYDHTHELISRFSAGQGYRSPLTFFESEHGLIGPDGFGVEVDEIERSNNAMYTLAYEGDFVSFSGSGSYTEVKNLAYIDDSGSRPILKSSKETVGITSADAVVGYALSPEWSVSGGYEQYWYDREYKELLYIAAVEKQARAMINYEGHGYDAMLSATWTASRDLEPYGYGDRYNDVAATAPKSTKAPSFTTVDFKISKQINKNFSLYAGVKNLFDYVQTDKESPLMYDAAGEYDVGHIWGPLRGRMTYAGINGKF
jgi:outer membrane receptor for ferrienterochelin and colicins